MSNYHTYNTYRRDLTLYKSHSETSPVSIPKENIQVLLFASNSKYKIKKNDTLVAKLWTNDQGWIIKYKNYDETNVFIKVNSSMNELYDQNRDLMGYYGGNPSIFICRRKDKEYPDPPLIS